MRSISIHNAASLEAVVSTQCPFCGTKRDVTVEAKGFRKWQGGALVQDAFPTLSSTDREALITGICNPCWEASFGEDS